MATFSILYNVVSFTELEVDTPVSLPHLLNVNEVPFVPRTIGLDGGGFTVTADEINVTITRTTDGGDSVNVYCEIPHTMDDVAPIPRTFTPPFIYGVGGSSGGLGGDYAMAIVANSEGPVLSASFNIASVAYDTGNLRLTLSTEVPDVTLALPLASLSGSPTGGIAVRMESSSVILVQITNAAGDPILSACNVRLALIPGPPN